MADVTPRGGTAKKSSQALSISSARHGDGTNSMPPRTRIVVVSHHVGYTDARGYLKAFRFGGGRGRVRDTGLRIDGQANAEYRSSGSVSRVSAHHV